MRRSDNPLAAIWRDLQRYSGLQRARRLFGESVKEDSIRTFCAYLELADSYAIVAEDAETTLDPLLMYYAAMWLARGVIATKLGIDVAENVKTHGAKVTAQSNFGLTLLGGTIKIQNSGTIPSLAQSLGGDVASDITFDILDLLRAIPELADVIEESLGIKSKALKIAVHPDILRAANAESNHVQIDFVGEDVPDVSGLPISPALEARGAKLAPATTNTIVMWDTPNRLLDELTTLFINTPDGYFVEQRIRGLYVPELVVYLAILHSLSVFTRYHPRSWLDVIAEYGPDYAIIREFMHVAERKVPELVLNELSGRTIVYRHG